MTAQAVYNVVAEYADLIRVTVHPHDLRRTFAKLAHEGNFTHRHPIPGQPARRSRRKYPLGCLTSAARRR
jgi:integrase